MRPWQRRPNVERLARKRDLAGLLAALDHEEVELDEQGHRTDAGTDVRSAALRAISSFTGPPVVRAIVRGLEDPYRSVRLAAVQAAAASGLPQVEGALLAGVAAWDDPPHGEAVQAATAVLAEGDAAAAPERFASILVQAREVPLDPRRRATLELLISEDRRGPDAAARAVAVTLISALDGDELGPDQRGRVRGLFEVVGAAGADDVIDALRVTDPDPLLIDVAGDLGDNRALEELVRLTGGGGPVRAVAVTALGAILDTRAIPVLMALTQDHDREVRTAANQAIAGFGAAGVVFGIAGAAQVAGGGAQTALGRPAAALESGADPPLGSEAAGGDDARPARRRRVPNEAYLEEPAGGGGEEVPAPVADMSDAALVELYALAQTQQGGEDDEYWDACLRAVLDEAGARPGFGEDFTPEDGLDRRGRRRQRRALHAVEEALAEREVAQNPDRP